MLKKRIVYYAALLMTITGVLGTPVICHGEENSETMTESSDLIAGEGERAAQQTVGEQGLEPILLRWIPVLPCSVLWMRN